MPFTNLNVQDDPEQSRYYLGFAKGLNSIQEKTLLDNNQLSLATNVMLDVDGVTRRYGSKKVFDTASASKVYGQGVFYNKSTSIRKFLRIANSRLQYLNGLVWDNVSSQVYSNLPTTFVQASGKIFIYNGTDPLTYYDGTSITTYTALSSLTGLAVAVVGTTGSTAYSYRVAAFNTVGETAACTAVAIANGNILLSSTNLNRLTWTIVSGATGYNIYGRTATGYSEVYLASVLGGSIVTYDDTGVDDEAESKLPSEYNTTNGIKAKSAIFTLGRQFAFGVTEGSTYYPTRLYYSGTVLNIDSFNSSEIGGGWVEIDNNNGGEIVDIKPFDSGVIVFKDNGIYKFYFTSTGDPAIIEITKSHGGCSFLGSQFINNDYMFVGQIENRIAVFSLGYQANYSLGQIRTNEVSVFISESLNDINRLYLDNICSFKYDNKFGFAYTNASNTDNNIGYVIDTRFGGWVKWDSDPMEVTSYIIYDDGTNAKLYGSSNSDGYTIELFNQSRNDSGSAFVSTIGTKFFNDGVFDIDKIFRNPVLWFKFIDGGSINVQVYVDGNNLIGTASLSSSSGGSGFGMDLFGSSLFGDVYSSAVIVTLGADVARELTLLQIKRSIGFYLIDNQADTNWLFMGLHLQTTQLKGKPLQQNEKVTVL